MNIQTKYFDEITIDEKDIIHFQNGVPGFLNEKQFVFLPLEDNSPYVIMQSTQTPEVAFVTVSPFSFFEDYQIKLKDQHVEQLQYETAEEATVFVILSLKEPLEKTTVNLVAPVLINQKKNIGKQIVLENTNYTTKHLIFQTESQEKEGRHADTQKKTK